MLLLFPTNGRLVAEKVDENVALHGNVDRRDDMTGFACLEQVQVHEGLVGRAGENLFHRHRFDVLEPVKLVEIINFVFALFGWQG